MTQVQESGPAEAAWTILEKDFASWVDSRPDLTALLVESHPLYTERSAAAVVRMRGWLLLELGRREWSNTALVYLLEELENGRSAYLVACAARSIRSAPAPLAAWAPLYVQALANIRDKDEYLDLQSYGGLGHPHHGTTAFAELLAGLEWLLPAVPVVRPRLAEFLASSHWLLSGPQREAVERILRIEQKTAAATATGDVDRCCDLPTLAKRSWRRNARSDIGHLQFEDQNAHTVGFNEFFTGKPSIVVFFYTRCDNPNKCSLTISRLARLQEKIRLAELSTKVRTAAMTYDEAWDHPARLKGYAESRGMTLDTDNRVMRAVSAPEALLTHFELSVNFVASLVNRHQIELFLVDARGKTRISFQRLRWDDADVLRELLELVNEENDPLPAVAGRSVALAGAGNSLTRTLSRLPSPLLAVAMALFPKCPICGATYLSLTGMAALPSLPPFYWLFPVMVLASAVNLVCLWWMIRGKDRAAFWLALSGTLVTLFLGIGRDEDTMVFIGVALSAAGSLAGISRLRLFSRTETGNRKFWVYKPFHNKTEERI